jgi:hypothetical protein
MGKTRTVNPFKNAKKSKSVEDVSSKIYQEAKELIEEIEVELKNDDSSDDQIFDTQVLDGIDEMLIQKEVKKEKKKKKGKVKRITRVDTSSEGENNENKG